MTIYRSPMEKILDKDENDTVITNPKDPGKTFLRKLKYKYALLKEKLLGPKKNKKN